MTNEADLQTIEAFKLSRSIQPVLHGNPSFVQGAALADLVSLWLSGHIIPGDPEATLKARNDIFNDWVTAVWKLVPDSEKEVLERWGKWEAKHV